MNEIRPKTREFYTFNEHMKRIIIIIFSIFFLLDTSAQTLVVLGTTQDAGKPQIGCQKSCCKNLKSRFFVASLGVSDVKNKKNYLFDATPDITAQFQLLSSLTDVKSIDGIFLTHAHSGHYTGLMYLGKEGMNASKIPVYAMPRLTNYLTNNGPWSQLVTLENINLIPLQPLVPITLDNGLVVMPIVVPHRDEYSETVGFKIIGTKKSALYIPDIDKWKLWEKDIIAEVNAVDYAFIDGTFFEDGEINRPIKDVPHPFISETVSIFKSQPLSVKQKIYFIHLNHTNPTHDKLSPQRIATEKLGFSFASLGAQFMLN
jgi:pyrroloquinoline quinone biosynthesis protein B